MEMKKVIICSVVGFLGLLSAFMGFAAEAKRIKPSQIHLSGRLTCVYPSSPALGLGLGAAAAILIAQIIVTAATGCFCCRRGSYQSNSKVGLICIIISWITCVNAFRLFISAAAETGRHKTEISRNGSIEVISCVYLKGGFFAGGAILSLVTMVLEIVGYLAWDGAKTSDNPWGGGTSGAPNQGGIAMGHPQMQFPTTQYPPPPQYPPGAPPPYPPPPQYPPPNAPAFVHEDTYMRRQYT